MNTHRTDLDDRANLLPTPEQYETDPVISAMRSTALDVMWGISRQAFPKQKLLAILKPYMKPYEHFRQFMDTNGKFLDDAIKNPKIMIEWIINRLDILLHERMRQDLIRRTPGRAENEHFELFCRILANDSEDISTKDRYENIIESLRALDLLDHEVGSL